MAARINGGVAQLGEHLPCKQGVMSSNLTISTKVMKRMSEVDSHGQAIAFMQMSLIMGGHEGIRRMPVMSKCFICESISRIEWTYAFMYLENCILIMINARIRRIRARRHRRSRCWS